MSLFEDLGSQAGKQQVPLAKRMMPRDFSELAGQEEIVGPGRLLRRAVEADRLTSAIFWGPAGSGKTSLAQIIAAKTRCLFKAMSAVMVGVADVRQVVKEARENLQRGKRTVLFLDEIHRFNKGQQDALLPYVEHGTVILLGATTENPYFTLNSALLSRMRLFRLKPLEDKDIVLLLRRALKDKERGLGDYAVDVPEEVLFFWARMSEGDARTALNALELAVLTTSPEEDGIRRLDLTAAQESIQKRALRYDRDGDGHYDTVSAFIKSIRGSDPDAGLYWLCRMLEAGEDPRFITRRLMILAAEDVGLADPYALTLTVSAAQCLEMIGLPEAKIPLAEAVIYLALAPKSNSAYSGLKAAEKEVQKGPAGEVPLHLRNAPHPGLSTLGHGKNYQYPHDYSPGYIPQQYRPEKIKGAYYQPKNSGREELLVKRWRQIIQEGRNKDKRD